MFARLRPLLARPPVAAAVLLALYVVLSLANDTRGYLGTDTGGKVATLEVMSRTGRLDPDVGYWAERWDPSGELHPLFYTSHFGDKWVNVTTLPVLFAALPLFDLGGYRAALFLPMAGSVAAALAARALALRLGSQKPMVAFWVVGLASLLTIYALDFWEHSIGVGLLAWAVVLLFDAARERERSLWRAAGAGVLIGAAFTLRTEALVYGAVATGVFMVAAASAGRVGSAVRLGAVVALGAVPPVLANLVLEEATVGVNLRLSRAGGVATAAGVTTEPVPGSRWGDALTTTFNLEPSLSTASHLLGIGAVVLVAWFVFRSRALLVEAETTQAETGEVGGAPVGDGGRFVRLLGALVIAMWAIRFVTDLGFVPGLFAATPIAAAALTLARANSASRRLVLIAAGSLPLVWLFQFRGGAVPQWGGRYQLTSAVLLCVVGLVGLELVPAAARRLLIGLSVAVTAFGLAWLAQRSHAIGDAGAALARRPEPVLISDIGHLFRETGATYGQHLALEAIDKAHFAQAVGVVEAAGYAEFGLVVVDDPKATPPTVPNWRPTHADRVELLPGVQLRITTYERMYPASPSSGR